MESWKPHFFKVMVGDYEQRLQIPNAYIKNILEESSKMATLEGPSGSRWQVRLNRSTSGMYLEDGWGRFSRAHSLSVGEFLLFRYNSNMNFSVQIFDKSTLEKADAFKVINSRVKGSKRRSRPQNMENEHHIRSWSASLKAWKPTQNAEHRRQDCLLEKEKLHQCEQSNSQEVTNCEVSKRRSTPPKTERTHIRSWSTSLNYYAKNAELCREESAIKGSVENFAVAASDSSVICNPVTSEGNDVQLFQIDAMGNCSNKIPVSIKESCLERKLSRNDLPTGHPEKVMKVTAVNTAKKPKSRHLAPEKVKSTRSSKQDSCPASDGCARCSISVWDCHNWQQNASPANRSHVLSFETDRVKFCSAAKKPKSGQLELQKVKPTTSAKQDSCPKSNGCLQCSITSWEWRKWSTNASPADRKWDRGSQFAPIINLDSEVNTCQISKAKGLSARANRVKFFSAAKKAKGRQLTLLKVKPTRSSKKDTCPKSDGCARTSLRGWDWRKWSTNASPADRACHGGSQFAPMRFLRSEANVSQISNAKCLSAKTNRVKCNGANKPKRRRVSLLKVNPNRSREHDSCPKSDGCARCSISAWDWLRWSRNASPDDRARSRGTQFAQIRDLDSEVGTSHINANGLLAKINGVKICNLPAGPEGADLLKVTQLKARKNRLSFQRSKIHDWGVVALDPIQAKDFVIEYVGELIHPQISDIRERKYEKMGIRSSYFFRLDDAYVVDATMCGGLARFINHSCEPNCYTKVVLVEGRKKIFIYAKRQIFGGEEITYNYKFPLEEEKIPCNCGSKRCRGSMN